MNIALYQVLVPIICVLLIAKAFSHYFRGEKTLRELIAWILFWGFISVIAIYPDITQYFAVLLGIKSNVNAIIFTVMGILTYLCFKLIVSVENTDQEITRLTREIALSDLSKSTSEEDTQ